jgi:Ca-activated chloride channel family protein
MAMSSPIDPATIPKPALDLVVVIDHSGSMAADGKLVYAKQGVKLLVDELGAGDTLTLIAFDDTVDVLFGPAAVVDKARIKGIIDELQPGGGTNIHDALERGYQEALRGADAHQRRVIFLTDGLPTAGNTSHDAIRIMSAGYNERYVQLTTVGVGVDAGLTLMRGLAEQGGGNFYFLENPEAAREVFLEELRFFVAPIAYDLDLSFDGGRAYTVKALHGTALWQRTSTGGKVHVPSVFLVSRTSTDPGDPGTGGGRRGGGAAIIAELKPDATLDGPNHTVAHVRLRYRLPGATTFETQDVPVTYGDAPGVCGEEGFSSHPEMDKNSIVMAFYVAFREATALAPTDRRGALLLLQRFQERIEHRVAGRDDEDLLDDLDILDRFITVLGG